MKKVVGIISILSVFLLLDFILFTIPSESSVSKPEKSEVIEEVSKVTGLTNDTVSLVFKESPQLLNNLSDAVTAIKIVNLLAEAKDSDAATEIFNYSAEKVLDKVLPTNVNIFLKAFKVYKTSLEIYRDYVYIPKLNEEIYARYRETRLENFKRDLSEDALIEAYQIATMDHTRKGKAFPNRNYYAVVNKMYEDYLKAKGYKKELMGKNLQNHHWNQIEKFWMYRMEARFVKEMIQEGRQDVINHIWKKYAQQLKEVQAKSKKIKMVQEPKQTQNKDNKNSDNQQRNTEMNQLKNIFEAQFSKDGNLTYSKPWQYDDKNKCYTFSYCYKGRSGEQWCWENVCVTQGQANQILKRGSWK